MARSKRDLEQAARMFDFAEFGPRGEAGEKGESLVILPLAHVRPDPGQPRRLLPADLAQALTQGKMEPAQVMQEWMMRAGEEGASPALKRTMRSLRSCLLYTSPSPRDRS